MWTQKAVDKPRMLANDQLNMFHITTSWSLKYVDLSIFPYLTFSQVEYEGLLTYNEYKFITQC